MGLHCFLTLVSENLGSLLWFTKFCKTAKCHPLADSSLEKNIILLEHDKTYKMTHVHSKDSDQPGHLSSLKSLCMALCGQPRIQCFFMLIA